MNNGRLVNLSEVLGGDALAAAYPSDNYPGQDSAECEVETRTEEPADNKMRPLSIEQLNYGYIVTVGCHKFALETYEKVTKSIGEYLADPSGTEAKWFNNELSLKRTR